MRGPGFPAWVNTGLLPLVATAVMAILLSLTLPGDKDAPEEARKEA